MQRAVRIRRRHHRRAEPPAPSYSRVVLAAVALLFLTVAGAIGLSMLGLTTAYLDIARELPREPSSTFAQQCLGPAKIYDRNGTLLYEFEDENEGLRNPVRLANISPYLIDATIATEDDSFRDNPGVNVRGLARAGIENFVDADSGILKGSGGSSITQQLVKNSFINEHERAQRTIDRKIKETVFALELTRKYSKDQILEWYLNQINYGNRAAGIGAAARRYFNTSAKDLTLAQSAFLAGLPQSPSRYNPYVNRDASIQRQYEVLDLMVRHGRITEEQAQSAEAEELHFAVPDVSLLAPHWVFYVRDALINRFGLDTFRCGGLRVTTTLDLNLQAKAEQIVEDKIAYYESPKGGSCECHNASLVAIDNNTGQILAMVGSRNYWRADIEGENNNAIAIKQPGSSFKPIVYLAAFQKGWNPGTTIHDSPTRFLSRTEGNRKEYFTPVGPTRSYLGPLSVRDALGSSMNTPAVRAAAFVGVDAVIDMAHRMGLTTLNDRQSYGVSIATGGANLTLLDLTYAYSTIANNGEMRGVQAGQQVEGHRELDPVALLHVEDVNGRVWYDFQGPDRRQVVQAGYAYQITDILKDNNAKRHTYTAPEYQFGMPDKRPVAAKTGTQQGPNDIKTVLATWNFGYVPDLTVGVWVGNANNALVNSNLTSASSSLLIWKEFMASAIDMLHIPPKEFPVPDDIEFQNVNGHKEPIVKGTQIVRSESQIPWVVKPEGGMPAYRPCSGGECDRRAPTDATPTPETPAEATAAPDSSQPARPAMPGLAPPAQGATPDAQPAPARPTVPGLPAPTPARPAGVPGLAPPPQPTPTPDNSP